ncbi:MAG: low molecular weight phosphotyrosine protein phosphatase [Crocinitomicaceae bacterium]|nr:low molecular weight phosphotyrosine protein phosphatase [Crocinitomicaceae bacterium]
MVCLGNICRSPMAHGILRKKINDLELNVQVDSAGTSSYHIGSTPDLRQQETAIIHNLDISDLSARQFTKDDFDKFDIIYAMDKDNLDNIMALSRDKNERDKVFLILNESQPNKNLDVPDPYYGGSEGFELVYNLLEQACTVIVKKIADGTYR